MRLYSTGFESVGAEGFGPNIPRTTVVRDGSYQVGVSYDFEVPREGMYFKTDVKSEDWLRVMVFVKRRFLRKPKVEIRFRATPIEKEED